MRFRKKPVEVMAIAFEATEDGIGRLRDFCGSALGRVIRPSPGEPAEAEICTQESDGKMFVRHIALEGDWVVRHPSGDLHPCRPDEFRIHYEPVTDEQVRPNHTASLDREGKELKPCRGAPAGSPESERYLRELGI
jgi:hypothetical protein